MPPRSDGICCQIRTAVLSFGFSLITCELIAFVLFYTFRSSLKQKFSSQPTTSSSSISIPPSSGRSGSSTSLNEYRKVKFNELKTTSSDEFFKELPIVEEDEHITTTSGDDHSTSNDLIVICIMILLDLIVNILLICGANKDYTGQQRDLRRWVFLIPWLIVYGLNILILLIASIYAFIFLPGSLKSWGLFALLTAIIILVGHLIVFFFTMEQRSDLDIFNMQRRNPVIPTTINNNTNGHQPPPPSGIARNSRSDQEVNNQDNRKSSKSFMQKYEERSKIYDL